MQRVLDHTVEWPENSKTNCFHNRGANPGWPGLERSEAPGSNLLTTFEKAFGRGLSAVLLVLGVTAGIATAANTAQPARPNFVFVLVDDLGWGDLSCYGNTRFKTPNIDRLAKEGILFTHYYQNGSVCSPARCSLLTSRYPAEMRIHGHLASAQQNTARDMPNFLDPQVPTLARLLQGAGYTTIHVGKWHLGRPPQAAEGLKDYGFDVARWIDVREGDRNLWRIEERPHASAVLIDAAIEELEAHQDEPFYCQVWLNDPHAPLAPSTEQMAPFRRSTPQGFTSPLMVYAATLTEMDRQIGRLLDTLDELGLSENTVVIFSSDNGPEDIDIGNATWSAYGSAGPLRGRKRSLYDGGIRVPFLVRWPAGTPAGKVNDRTIISGVDLLPTLCDLAGVSLPEEVRKTMRGESMAPAIRGEGSFRRSGALMWEWRFRVFNHPWNRSPMLAIREGDWKLLINPFDPEEFPTVPAGAPAPNHRWPLLLPGGPRVELYNIPRDPGEQHNVANEHPQIALRLARQVLAWQKTLPPGLVEPSAGKNDYPWPAEK